MENPRPHPEWKILMDKTRSIDFGSGISYDQIRTWTGIDPEHGTWRSMIQSWKKHMEREENKFVVPVYGKKQYRILLPEETERYAVNFVRLAGNRVRRGIRVIQNAPLLKLNDPQRVSLSNVAARMGVLAQMVKESYKSLLPTGEDGKKQRTPRILR